METTRIKSKIWGFIQIHKTSKLSQFGLHNRFIIMKKHNKYKTEVTGAEAVILALLDEQVTDIFGYPGGAIMPVYDALYDYMDKLNHYLVRQNLCPIV